MNDRRLTGVLARRALHRSRSVAVSVALALVAIIGLGLAALVLAPVVGLDLGITAASLVSAVRSASPVVLIVAGVLVLLGFAALIAAVTPGRLARHRVDDDRAVVLVDDDVLAGAVSGHTARAFGVAPDQVTTAVDRRRVTTRIRPTSGRPLEREQVAAAVRDYADGLDLTGGVRTRSVVAAEGVVGA